MKSKYLILLFIIPSLLNAQNYEWLNSFGHKGSDNIIGISTQSNGECVMAIYNSSSLVVNDTLYFDKYKFKINEFPNIINNIYLVRLDSNGKVLNAKGIGYAFIRSFCGDNYGNVYISCSFNIDDNRCKIDTLNLNKSNGKAVVAKFDKNFDLKWIVQTGNDTTSQIGVLKYCNNKLYFIGGSSDTTSIAYKTYYFKKVSTSLFGEINTQNGSILWSNYLHINSCQEILIYDMISLNNKLYFAGISPFNCNGAKINSDTILPGSGFIIMTDSLGIYIKNILFKSKYTNIRTISSDGKNIYVGGCFSDTVFWGAKKFSPFFKSGSNINEFFVAAVTYNLKPLWFYSPKVTKQLSNSYNINNIILKLTTSKGFIYIGGKFDNEIMIDSTIFSPKNVSSMLFLKMDSLNNVLWATSGNNSKGTIISIDANKENSVFVSGNFLDTVRCNSFFKLSKGSYDVFITKITDYSITRGKVSPGPYCAGDTILIPYSKF
ncbi:MAG: hypothetical protein HUU47_11015, partial [Bacteroidetes bacterium]|nr:hypothetical protein [Bacteroidota bacterium]